MPGTHLSKAPIREALIDIRATVPSETTIKVLEAFQDLVREDYPVKKPRGTFSVPFRFEPGQPPKVGESEGGLDGYLFHSPDGSQVVQARRDGFTFSRLYPYETWERLRNEARRLWELYRSLARPSEIQRIAVRYINRFDVPRENLDVRQWNLSAPTLSPWLPRQMSEFFVRLVVPFESETIRAIITQTTAPTESPEQTGLLFDIDVFQEQVIDCAASDLWERFEKLRDIKNQVFFYSLPYRVVEMYQ